MANKKIKIKATESELQSLYDALKIGTPLQIALQRANIKLATYYYWVAISSIVVVVKTQEEIEEIERIAKSGVSLEKVRSIAESMSSSKKTGIGSFIEPSAESVLRYKNSVKFREFADQCYEIIQTCDQMRAECVNRNINAIAVSVKKMSGYNPSGAMWWLERNLPDFFAKPSEKGESESTVAENVPAIEVEFINPDTPETRKRIEDMEQEIEKDYKTGGTA